MSQSKSSLEYHNFKPEINEFHAENALFLAKHARLAYEESTLIEHVCKNLWGMQDFQFIEHRSAEDDVQAYVCARADCVIVAFRGTEANKIQDWVNNMDTLLDNRFRGSVHRGFMRSVDFICEELKATIQTFQKNNQKLFFCGHSQGGALANLAAAQALEEGMNLHQVYTFGQPRAGNLLFAGLFNKKFKAQYFRVVNHGDIITRVPTRKSDYSHCGTFIFLDQEGELHTNSAYWKSFWDDLGLSIFHLLDMAIDKVEEHETGAYITKLAALA